MLNGYHAGYIRPLLRNTLSLYNPLDRVSKTYRLDNNWVRSGIRFVILELDGLRCVFRLGQPV